MHYFLQGFIQVFHLVGTPNISRSVYSCATVHIDNLLTLFIKIFFHLFHQCVKFIKANIIIVLEDKTSDEEGDTGWINQRAQHKIVFVG